MRPVRFALCCSVVAVGLFGVGSSVACGGGAEAWRGAEAGDLSRHVQLTFPDRFVKAGEAYFSPDAKWIVFQAVPLPPRGESPSPHYQMYVAKLTRGEDGGVSGVEDSIQISPDGSANTCGFFHPTAPWRLIFGSTVEPPEAPKQGGYQRGQSQYVWQFPEEMEVCSRTVPQIFYDLVDPQERNFEIGFGADARGPRPLWERPGYDAECAYSPDGRFIVYTAVDPETQDGDIYIRDTQTGETHPIVVEEGYDGGPFFSPDGTRLCYRSDREGNDLLQVFVADLEFDDRGVIVGMEREHQLTDNRHVNWAPYWHPSGEFLVYTSSEVGHHKYEVYSIEAPERGAEASGELKKRRITNAPGFDGMPVFSGDGSLLMWTSQRGPKASDEDRPSSQVWIAEANDLAP